MSRFILRYTGRGKLGKGKVRIRAAKGVRIVEESLPHMFLVEASDEAIRQLAESLPDWSCTKEQFAPLPDARPKVRQ